MIVCPQCDSRFCGDYRCRFSNRTHKEFRENLYATRMVEAQRYQSWRPDHDLDVNGRPLKQGS